ncbi:hypothetical protein ACIBF1_15550 [Spirillospora sp. NPDC050679]
MPTTVANTAPTASSADKLVERPLTGRALRELFVPVLPHLPTGPYPDHILNHIAVEVRDGALYLMATDRYTLSVHRRPLEQPVADFSLTLPAAAVRTLLRTIAARHQVAIELTPGGLNLLHHYDRHATPTEHVIRASGAVIVGWRSLLAPYMDQAPDAPTTLLDPHLLARFAAAPGTTGKRLDVRSYYDVTVITCGDHFFGAIKPCRSDDRHRDEIEADRTAWRRWTALPDTVPDAA